MAPTRNNGLRIKIAAGALGGLLLVCLAGGYLLIETGGAEKALELTGEIQGMADHAREVERLNRESPFTPPEDGSVPEDRLEAYISVCETIKPAVDALAQPPAEGGRLLSRTGTAVEARRTLLAGFSETLRTRAMSAREFSWIHNAMQLAKGEAAVKADRIAAAETLPPGESSRERPADEPDAPAGESRFEKDIASIIGPPSANARLYSRYAETLKACEWGEQGDFILHGLGHSQSVRVTVVTEE